MFKQETSLPFVGGIIAAIGASLCCVGPFVLLLLGVSGSWISQLTYLEPYRPLFILGMIGLFGWAGWQVYQPIELCEPDSVCAIPHVRKRRQIIFWLTSSLALVLISSSYWIPLII